MGRRIAARGLDRLYAAHRLPDRGARFRRLVSGILRSLMMIEGNSAEAVAASCDDAATAIGGLGAVGHIHARGQAIASGTLYIGQGMEQSILICAGMAGNKNIPPHPLHNR